MPLLLEALLPLLRKRDTYYVAAIAVLALLLWAARGRYRADEVVIASRPRVETHVEQQVKTVRVAGPVRVETKTVYVPGTKEIQYVDRIVEAAPVTTTTQKETESDKIVQPACPAAPRFPSRFVGVSTSPLDPTKAIGVKAGMTVFQVIDLSSGYEFYGAGQDRIRVEAAYRF